MATKWQMLVAGWLVVASAGAAQAERINIAAVVNDDIITTSDVNDRRDLLLAGANIAPTVENQQRILPRVMQTLIDEAIEMQEAKRLSITVTSEQMAVALRQVEQARRMEPGSLPKVFAQQGLSLRSLKAQLRAQIAWNKVVQRKLRREVSISQDEILRAQQAAAADPGVPQVRIAAISMLAPTPEMEKTQAAFAKELANKIDAGASLAQLANELQGRPDIRISPPGWVDENNLQPAMQQALRALQPGQVSPPLKSLNTFQLVQLLERRMAKKVPDATEIVIKEMVLPPPPTPDAKSLQTLRTQVAALVANPGDCLSDTVAAAANAKAKFSRLSFGQLPAELKPVIAELGVTQVSPPIANETGVRLYMLCERIDAPLGNLPPAEEVRRALFNEKIELEAQKHLRNLKRDAFIEIKGDAAKAPNA